MMIRWVFGLLLVLMPLGAALAQGQEIAPLKPGGMTVDRLGQIIATLDPAAQRVGNAFQFTVQGVGVQVVTDPAADRMRIVIPIAEVQNVSQQVIQRAMQANFDSALDARYAIARDLVWSTYIHPLSPLVDKQFLSGLAQTITAARTFGTSFTSGAMTFGGGDSNDLLRDLEKQFEAL